MAGTGTIQADKWDAITAFQLGATDIITKDGSGNVTVTHAGGGAITLSGTVSMTSTLSVTGNTTLGGGGGALGFSGSATVDVGAGNTLTLARTVSCTGPVSLSSTLAVTGNVGFNGQSPAAAQTYTPTNVVTDRSYDADSTSTAELADVLGTLIADLQTVGLLQ